MSEEPLLPNPIGKLRKAVAGALDKLVEPKDVRFEREVDPRRRALLGGAAATVVIGPAETAKQVAQTLLPNAATVAQTIAAGGKLGKVVEKIATNWAAVSQALDKTGQLITDMGGEYGYNPILEDFPAHITDNYGPQWTLRGLSNVDLSKIPSDLRVEDFAPDRIDQIAEALGGEVSKGGFGGKLKNLSKILGDLQKRGESTGRHIETIADAQQLFKERFLETTKDLIDHCDPELLDDLTLFDLDRSLKEIHGIDPEQLHYLKRAQVQVWERKRKQIAESKKKWVEEEQKKVKKSNEALGERKPEDRVVKCRILADHASGPEEKAFVIRPDYTNSLMPFGFRGLTRIHFLDYLRTIAKTDPAMAEALGQKTIFPTGTKVDQTAIGELHITTSNTIIQDLLGRFSSDRRPDKADDGGGATRDKIVKIPFLTQIVAPIKE